MCIGVAIRLSEKADVQAAAVHFMQVGLVGTPVAGGQVLEQEHLEVLAQQGIVGDEGLEGTTLGGQFLLNAADEEDAAGHGVT